MYLSRRLPLAAMALGAVALVSPFDPWATLAVGAVSLAGLAAWDVTRAPRPSALGLERVAAPVTGVGQAGEILVRLRNPERRPLEVAVRDAAPPSLGRTPRDHRVRLAPRGAAELAAAVHPTRRGYARLGPVAVRTSGPLGLAGRQATLPDEDRIKVYPALPGRAEAQLRLERARLLQTGQRSSAFRGGGTEFDSLRDYHPDDEFRRINWRATARSGRAITNLYREERNQQVMLLFDASRTMAGNLGGVTRFEHALDAGFAVADLAARVGDHVGMVAFSSRVLAMAGPRGGRHQPRGILDRLFDLEPALEAADYRDAFAALLARYRRRSLLVLLTELAEASTMESLFASLPALLARHLVVVGSIRDPETEGLARLVPSDSEGAFRKAAAAETVAERDRTAARLRAMGVVVEDRPPGALAGALVDRYLRIKSTGRL